MNSNLRLMKAFLSLMLAVLAILHHVSAQSYINEEFFTLLKRINFQKILNMKGEKILLNFTSVGQYIVPQVSQLLFIVYLDAHLHLRSQIIQAIQ